MVPFSVSVSVCGVVARPCGKIDPLQCGLISSVHQCSWLPESNFPTFVVVPFFGVYGCGNT